MVFSTVFAPVSQQAALDLDRALVEHLGRAAVAVLDGVHAGDNGAAMDARLGSYRLAQGPAASPSQERPRRDWT